MYLMEAIWYLHTIGIKVRMDATYPGGRYYKVKLPRAPHLITTPEVVCDLAMLKKSRSSKHIQLPPASTSNMINH